MEMNSANVEAVVKQVLESMLEKKVPEAAPAQKAAGNEIPKTAHVAMLTALEHFEIKEYPMPEVGDGARIMTFIISLTSMSLNITLDNCTTPTD